MLKYLRCKVPFTSKIYQINQTVYCSTILCSQLLGQMHQRYNACDWHFAARVTELHSNYIATPQSSLHLCALACLQLPTTSGFLAMCVESTED